MNHHNLSQTSYEELPVVLTVSHVQSILGISKTSAYALVHTEGFPATRLNGHLIRVSKKAFFDWLEKAQK